jgi:hypothetical protein
MRHPIFAMHVCVQSLDNPHSARSHPERLSSLIPECCSAVHVAVRCAHPRLCMEHVDAAPRAAPTALGTGTCLTGSAKGALEGARYAWHAYAMQPTNHLKSLGELGVLEPIGMPGRKLARRWLGAPAHGSSRLQHIPACADLGLGSAYWLARGAGLARMATLATLPDPVRVLAQRP